MIIWEKISRLFNPFSWIEWLWRNDNHELITLTAVKAQDSCAKCNRFLSLHSANSIYCSYHNVTWNICSDRTNPYQLFRGPFEMWLRSRCGGNLDETQIATDMLTLSSYLDYALIHAKASANMYDFCDDVFADYQMVYDFLLDMRSQAKVKDMLEHAERHPEPLELRICDGIHHFIEFRKFQLPGKGIIENKYSATERMLESYKTLLQLKHPHKVLHRSEITQSDLDITITHFLPQYQIIIDCLYRSRQRSYENGSDLDFATSFLLAYIYRLMPSYIKLVHLVRVRDILPTAEHSIELYGQIEVQQSRFVCSYDLPSPTVASACISKIQESMVLDQHFRDMVNAYITHIRPRITKSNDYLLLDLMALGLMPGDVEKRIVTLVYRATGKVTSLINQLEKPIHSSTPYKETRLASSTKSSTPRQNFKSKTSSLSATVKRKYLKLSKKKKLARKKLLLLDLTALHNEQFLL